MSKNTGRQGRAKAQAKLDTLGIVHPHAAGIDIGSREIWVALPPGRGDRALFWYVYPGPARAGRLAG